MNGYQEPFSRSFDKKQKPNFGLQIDTTNDHENAEDDGDHAFNPLRSPSYEYEVNDMAKTSMFGGLI